MIRGTVILAEGHGVTIAYDLDPNIHTAATWDPGTRTFHIRRGSPPTDSAVLISDLWRLLTIGIRATQALPMTRPPLRLIPTDRTA